MPVRVVISPAQSSFFAGEPFAATIAFTNVAEPSPAQPRHLHHKRGAHSVSSAPLARPPTSPGLPPRTSSAFARDSLPARKGLVGAPAAHDRLPFADARHPPASPRLSAPLSRTDTLALSSDHPHARKSSILDGHLSLDTLSPTTSIPPPPPPSLTTISESSHAPSTPRISSPLSPSYSHPAFQPSSNITVQAYPSAAETSPYLHHHRRFSQQTQIGLGHPTPPQSAFASTFPKSDNTELILYSYAQLVGTVHVLPESLNTNGVPSSTPEQTLRMNRIRRMLTRRRAVVGGGSMDISRSLHHQRSWSSVGGGTQPYPNHQQQQQQPRRRHQPYQHSRSASFSQSLISLLSPSPSAGAGLTRTPSYNNVSMPGGGHGLGLGISTNTTHNITNPIDEQVDPQAALPTFEAQPSMLAVDLVLAPGESKSYTYTIKLPDVLPPTYRGRALSFSYELVVGTCRAGSLSPPHMTNAAGGGGNSVSRVMKVPIRVYNHVTVDHPPRPYDILWPVTHNLTRGYYQHRGGGKEMAIPEVQGRVVEENDHDDDGDGEIPKWMVAMRRKRVGAGVRLPSSGRKGEDEICLSELKQYTKRLLTSLPPPPSTSPHSVNGKPNDEGEAEEAVSPISSLPDSSTSSLPPSTTPTLVTNNPQSESKNKIIAERRREEEEDKSSLITGCREAVEILTRLPKKASYDVNKEGVKVAVLTFTKSAYRLGETVCGVVELNERVGRSRVVQLSAILEAHEVLPRTVVASGKNGGGGLVRRAYAEHYAAFTLNTVRTTFALDIPSDASPAFQVKIDDDDHHHPHHHQEEGGDTSSSSSALGGLEWKIRLCLLVGVASEEAGAGSEGVLFRNLERDGGRGEWGSSWCAPRRFVPLEKRKVVRGLVDGRQGGEAGGMMTTTTRSWTKILVDSMWSAVTGVGVDEEDEEGGRREGEEGKDVNGVGNLKEYDGVKPDLGGGIGRGVDFSGDDDDDDEQGVGRWEEVKLETVECEVPIKVWPGNTAFRAVDVVFDV